MLMALRGCCGESRERQTAKRPGTASIHPRELTGHDWLASRNERCPDTEVGDGLREGNPGDSATPHRKPACPHANARATKCANRTRTRSRIASSEHPSRQARCIRCTADKRSHHVKYAAAAAGRLPLLKDMPSPSARHQQPQTSTFARFFALAALVTLVALGLQLSSTSKAVRRLSSFWSSHRAAMTTSTQTRAPAIALSHGGGPMPLLGDPSHDQIVHSLRTRVPEILRLGTPQAPRAIALVTAHWSEARPTISSGSRPSLLYDYYGFPPESYEVTYDAPGSPEIAKEVANAMRVQGLDPVLDDERGMWSANERTSG